VNTPFFNLIVVTRLNLFKSLKLNPRQPNPRVIKGIVVAGIKNVIPPAIIMLTPTIFNILEIFFLTGITTGR
jgi:hypothetical protein